MEKPEEKWKKLAKKDGTPQFYSSNIFHEFT